MYSSSLIACEVLAAACRRQPSQNSSTAVWGAGRKVAKRFFSSLGSGLAPQVSNWWVGARERGRGGNGAGKLAASGSSLGAGGGTLGGGRLYLGAGPGRACPPRTIARRRRFEMEEPQRQVWCLQAAAQNFPRHALEPRLRFPVATWLPGWAPGPGFASGG